MKLSADKMRSKMLLRRAKYTRKNTRRNFNLLKSWSFNKRKKKNWAESCTEIHQKPRWSKRKNHIIQWKLVRQLILFHKLLWKLKLPNKKNILTNNSRSRSTRNYRNKENTASTTNPLPKQKNNRLMLKKKRNVKKVIKSVCQRKPLKSLNRRK